MQVVKLSVSKHSTSNSDHLQIRFSCTSATSSLFKAFAGKWWCRKKGGYRNEWTKPPLLL